MNKFTKRLLTGVVALGLLVPVASTAVSPSEAHASMFYRTYYHNTWTPRARHTGWFDGVYMKRGRRYVNKDHVYINRHYLYWYDKPFDQGSDTIRMRLHYVGHRTWRARGDGFSATVHYISNHKISVRGLGFHYYYR